MFLASRLRRRIVVLIPAIAGLLFALMSFFIVRGNPPNVADWRLLFWITLAVGVVFSVLAFLVPEKTKKRLRFEALAPVPANLTSWFIERRQQGKVTVPYYLVVLFGPENLYISSDIAGQTLKLMATAHEEHRLVPMIEERFSRAVSKTMEKVPIHLISAIRADEKTVTLVTAEGDKDYQISNQVNYEQVAGTLAAIVLPGSVGRVSVTEQTVGLVRKKQAEVRTVAYSRVGLINDTPWV